MIYVSITSTILFAIGLFLTFRCRHAWTLVSDKEFPSRVRELKDSGVQAIPYDFAKDLHELGSKVYVAIVKCDKCGALRTFKEAS